MIYKIFRVLRILLFFPMNLFLVSPKGIDTVESLVEFLHKVSKRPGGSLGALTIFKRKTIFKIPHVEKLIEKVGVWVKETYDLKSGTQAVYKPFYDSILLYPRENYISDAHFYNVFFHELAHATGHHSRLNRNLTESKTSYDIAETTEELIAELTTYIVSEKLGFATDKTRLCNINYMALYMFLGEFPKIMFETVAIEALKASKMILEERMGERVQGFNPFLLHSWGA